MSDNSKYFSLSLDSLRAIGAWAADCAERALPIFENFTDADSRPRDAIDAVREFAQGGKRIGRLRTIALAAFSAARETDNSTASAAATAAGLAASSAYTHPLKDIHQTKHIEGPAAYAAFALELVKDGDQSIGDSEIALAAQRAPMEACSVLYQMPVREDGKSRLEHLMYVLDTKLREKFIASSNLD